MGRTARNLLVAGAAVAAVIVAVGAIDAALAQSPFGVGAPKSAPATPYSGIVGWIMQKQAEYYKSLSGAIRAARTDGSALWVLFGLSFAYGLFHAAGPGHGKAVISSYVVANRETWWRGVVLSFASAMVQAAVAVAVVGIAAVLLNATAATMKTAVYWIEIVSYLLIIWIGLRLVVTKGWAFVRTIRDGKSGAIEGPALATALAIVDVIVTLLLAGILTKAATGSFDPLALLALRSPDYRAVLPALVLLAVWLVVLGFLWRLWGGIRELTHTLRPPRTVGAAATPTHLQAHHDHAHHDHHDHAHHDHAHSGHDHDHHDHDHAHCDHDHGSAWSHAHAPEPSELAGPGGWKRGLSAIVAVGLRPCSGAILVLVFTLAQGLFWAGVVATFVMGLGTAIMVATIAVFSVLATAWAERFASTRGGYGMLFMRGIEVAAALLITAFGALLLMGYMATERLLA